MGREIGGMNASMGKHLNVDRNEELRQISIQGTVRRRKHQAITWQVWGALARKMINSTGVDSSGVGRPRYGEVRVDGIAEWVISSGIEVCGI